MLLQRDEQLGIAFHEREAEEREHRKREQPERRQDVRRRAARHDTQHVQAGEHQHVDDDLPLENDRVAQRQQEVEQQDRAELPGQERRRGEGDAQQHWQEQCAIRHRDQPRRKGPVALAHVAPIGVEVKQVVEHVDRRWAADKPFAFWPPGTPFIYAAIYSVFGTHYTGIVVLNIVLSAVLIVCTARVAARWFGERVALVAAAVLAVWPTLVLFTTVLASELPYLALTVAALDAWTLRRRSLYFRASLAGLLLGCAALVRPQALVLPLLYAAGLWVWDGMRRDAFTTQLRIGAVAAVVMALVIAPWTLRNYKLYGAPVLRSAGHRPSAIKNLKNMRSAVVHCLAAAQPELRD